MTSQFGKIKTVRGVILAVAFLFLVPAVNLLGSGSAPVIRATGDACPLQGQSGRTIIRFNTTINGSYIRSDKTEAEAKLGPIYATIPAGDYRVTLVSYDDHFNKLTQVQLSEQWFVKINNSAGDEIAVTNPIGDLPDSDDWKTELVNENLNIPDEVSSLMAIHAAYPNNESANSIDPICAAFDEIAPVQKPECVLNISKEVNKASANVGDVLTYTLNFSNTGTADCTGGGVKVRDIVDSNLAFIGETHSDNVFAGYDGSPLYDESNRELIWDADDLVPGEAGSVSWTATVEDPGNCGNFSIFNKGTITSWEYSEFNRLVESNQVQTDISNECPPADTLIHILKRSCPSWSVISGNGAADSFDATGGHFTEFVNYSQDLPHFADVYGAKPVSPAEIPGSCKAQAGWNFKLATDIDQSQNVTTVGPTNANGEIEIKVSELTAEQQSAVLNNGRLWVSEIMESSHDFGQLRCYRDAEYGDNIDYVEFMQGEALPNDVYCIAYNVKPLPPEVVIALTKTASPTDLPPSGGLVAYSYVATNPGSVPLSDVFLSDDKCAPVDFIAGDANSDQKLDANESWTYTCQKNITETTTNTATVTGKYASDTATASAIAKVTVQPAAPEPAINILKTANPNSLPVGGGEVAYSYVVSNAGNVPLSNVSVSDDKCISVIYGSGDTNADLKLDLAESWIYNCTTSLLATTTNIATASGKYGDKTVTKTATATVTVAQLTPAPAIHVSKSPDKTSLPVGGGNVTYSYTITNPGNVILTDITLTDDKCSAVAYVSGDLNTDNKLDLAESWKYSCVKNLTETTTNTAKATGKGNDQTVTSEAKATVSVSTGGGGCTSGCGGGGVLITNAIKVAKTPVPNVLPSSGGDVVYKYAVTNPGSSQLHDVTLVDDKCSDVKYISGDTNNDKWLANSETWNYECKTALTAETINTATATGYAGSEKVTHNATAKVTLGLSQSSIKLTKTPNLAALPAKGGKVTYSYVISNPGAEPLRDITLMDDKCSAVKFVSGDINADDMLDTKEKWNYTCETNLTETTTNFATARGRVGTSYATDTASATVTVGEKIVPIIMPKTGGGAASQEDRNKDILISATAWIMIAGYALKVKRA